MRNADTHTLHPLHYSTTYYSGFINTQHVINYTSLLIGSGAGTLTAQHCIQALHYCYSRCEQRRLPRVPRALPRRSPLGAVHGLLVPGQHAYAAVPAGPTAAAPTATAAQAPQARGAVIASGRKDALRGVPLDRVHFVRVWSPQCS